MSVMWQSRSTPDREQVLALAQSGQRRGVDLVALRPQEPRDGLVAPATVAATVYQDIGGGHRASCPNAQTAGYATDLISVYWSKPAMPFCRPTPLSL